MLYSLSRSRQSGLLSIGRILSCACAYQVSLRPASWRVVVEATRHHLDVLVTTLTMKSGFQIARNPSVLTDVLASHKLSLGTGPFTGSAAIFPETGKGRTGSPLSCSQ